MSDFTDKLNQTFPVRTAGALPSTRTYGMVEEALASDDIEVVKAELVHSRAHYQALEYMLNSEARLIETFLDGLANDPETPKPETTEDVVRILARVYGTVVLEAAYDTAHSTGFFMGVLGMDLQTALQNLYADLDWSDPERELSEAELQALATPPVETDEG